MNAQPSAVWGSKHSEVIDGSKGLDPAAIFVVSFYIWEKLSKHIKLKLKYSR